MRVEIRGEVYWRSAGGRRARLGFKYLDVQTQGYEGSQEIFC
ncbi:MAG: hypothetical protein CLLPBCKN_006363 [Chroococcidiopsis cubana SAG 39.79]|nr:hypothetical protein [Chroococcidiopsis cubana SAG 39.79]